MLPARAITTSAPAQPHSPVGLSIAHTRTIPALSLCSPLAIPLLYGLPHTPSLTALFHQVEDSLALRQRVAILGRRQARCPPLTHLQPHEAVR